MFERGFSAWKGREGGRGRKANKRKVFARYTHSVEDEEATNVYLHLNSIDF